MPGARVLRFAVTAAFAIAIATATTVPTVTHLGATSTASGTGVGVPRLVRAPAGARPVARSTFWKVPAPDGSAFTLEKYDAPGPGLHPTVAIFPGSGNWSTSHEVSASMFAAQGFTGISLCWFRTARTVGPGQLACPDAPPAWGVAARGLSDMNALVAGIKRLPGVDPDRVALLGGSRGGGEVALIATQGGHEPVIAVSGLFDPRTFVTMPTETDVVARAGGIRAPVFLIYGVDDTFVRWQVNSVPMAAAIRDAHRAPAPILRGYRGGHCPDLLNDAQWGTAPDARRIFADELSFLRSRLAARRASSSGPPIARSPRRGRVPGAAAR